MSAITHDVSIPISVLVTFLGLCLTTIVVGSFLKHSCLPGAAKQESARLPKPDPSATQRRCWNRSFHTNVNKLGAFYLFQSILFGTICLTLGAFIMSNAKHTLMICKTAYSVLAFITSTSRMNIHLFFLYRLVHTFKNTGLSITHRTIKLFIVVFSVHILVFIGLASLVITSSITVVSSQPYKSYRVCQLNHTYLHQPHIIGLIGFQTVVDTLILVALTRMFTSKMSLLLSKLRPGHFAGQSRTVSSGSRDQQKRDDLRGMQKLIRKSFVGFWVCILSAYGTWAFLLFSMNNLVTAVAFLDMIINALCIYAMFTFGNGLYSRTCGYLECCVSCCWSPDVETEFAFYQSDEDRSPTASSKTSRTGLSLLDRFRGESPVTRKSDEVELGQPEN